MGLQTADPNYLGFAKNCSCTHGPLSEYEVAKRRSERCVRASKDASGTPVATANFLAHSLSLRDGVLYSVRLLHKVGCKIEDTTKARYTRNWAGISNILSELWGIPSQMYYTPRSSVVHVTCCPILSLSQLTNSLCDSQISIIDGGPFRLMNVD